MNTAKDWISKLQLRPHPEGGHYRETYRSANLIQPPGYSGPRAFSTSIYFLLQAGECSRFHRMMSDEIWHFHDGGPLTIHLLQADGTHQQIRLGRDFDRGEVLQAVIPAGIWFGAAADQPDSFTLFGCAVAPGFDFADFEMARRETLLALHPKHRDLILRLTEA